MTQREGFPIPLRPEQEQCLRELQQTVDNIVMVLPSSHPTNEELARMKARCEEFLAFPIIQALSTEDL